MTEAYFGLKYWIDIIGLAMMGVVIIGFLIAMLITWWENRK